MIYMDFYGGIMSVDSINQFLNQSPEELINAFCLKYSDFYTDEEILRIKSAWEYLISKTKDTKRKSGHPYYLHPMSVVHILAQYHFGVETIVAGFLHNILEKTKDQCIMVTKELQSRL